MFTLTMTFTLIVALSIIQKYTSLLESMIKDSTGLRKKRELAKKTAMDFYGHRT